MEMSHKQLDIPVWSSGERSGFRLESLAYMVVKICEAGKSPKESKEIKWLRRFK